jgi:hypothetical protein
MTIALLWRRCCTTTHAIPFDSGPISRTTYVDIVFTPTRLDGHGSIADSRLFAPGVLFSGWSTLVHYRLLT